MAAAEMERRIGLMGRLNDAAARLRQQPEPEPEPEVADHDAELWYAASGPSCRNGTSWERPTWWC